MVSNDRIHLLLRWEFVPVQDKQDRTVRWTWRAHEQSGKLAMQSEKLFDSLIECVDDAKRHGGRTAHD
jgi:hypothetical protein